MAAARRDRRDRGGGDATDAPADTGDRRDRRDTRLPARREANVLDDDRFGGAVMEEFIEDVFSDIGAKIGDSGMLRELFQRLKGVDGNGLFGSYALSPILQAMTNRSGLLGHLMRSNGASDLTVMWSSTAMDGFIEGLRRKYRDSRNGQLTREDVYDVKRATLNDLAAKMAEPMTHQQALMVLNREQEVLFERQIEQLSADDQVKFARLRPKLINPKDLLVLRDLPTQRWMAHLEAKFPSTAASPADTATSRIDRAVATAGRVVRQILGDPPTPAPAQVDPHWYARRNAKRYRG